MGTLRGLLVVASIVCLVILEVLHVVGISVPPWYVTAPLAVVVVAALWCAFAFWVASREKRRQERLTKDPP
jgi:protein-S-isoprenylcysteine O-methyltransferase Ste14